MSMDDPTNGEDWRHWGKHVLAMQQAHQVELQRVNERLTSIEIKLGIMQGKAAAYGTIAGLITSVVIGLAWRVLFK